MRRARFGRQVSRAGAAGGGALQDCPDHLSCRQPGPFPLFKAVAEFKAFASVLGF